MLVVSSKPVEVSKREARVVARHLPSGYFKKSALGWSRYRDANPVPKSPLADDIAIMPSGPVRNTLKEQRLNIPRDFCHHNPCHTI